jgi:hypothetical protein
MHNAWAISVLCARICIVAREVTPRCGTKLAAMQKSLILIPHTIKVDLSPPRDSAKIISFVLSRPPESTL